MDVLDRIIRTWVVGAGRDEDIHITAGKATLLDVVKSLGPFLTSEEEAQRVQGIDFLTSVLSECPPTAFNTRSTRVLTSFYCEKLTDTDVIKPSLAGLKSLSSLPSFLSEDALTTVRAIFSQSQIKTSPVAVRFTALNVIDTLVARHREALQEINDEFITGFLALADGEKDPRDLLVIFAIERVLILEFNTVKFTERLFDSICCYFPISFRPPPNDPYGITTEDLSSSLRLCLSSTPEFGPPAVPFFLDKLNTGSPAAKRETLVTLNVCLPVYGPALARASARKLWSSLKLEIFQPTDSVTEIEALRTVQTLVKTIYPHGDADGLRDEMQGLAKDACEECLEVLREPEKSMAKPAMKVLCAFMSTTASVSQYTMAQTVPYLIKLFRNPDEATSRPSTLSLLADLEVAARDSTVADSSKLEQSEVNLPLSPFKDDVLAIGTFGLKQVESRRSAVAVLKGLVTTTGLCTVEEIGFIVHSLEEYLKPDANSTEDSSDCILDLLSSIAEVNPRPVEEQTLPALFSALPDDASLFSNEKERNECWLTLGALSQLCVHPELFATFTRRMSTKLDLICVPSVAPQSLQNSVSYAYSLLATISKTLELKTAKDHADTAKYLDSLVWRLYNLFVFSALSPEEPVHFISRQEKLVQAASGIITLVVQILTVQQQQSFADSLFQLFLHGDLTVASAGQHKLPTSAKFSPLESTDAAQRNLLYLLQGAVVAFHKEISIPDISTLLQTLTIWSQDEGVSSFQREAVWHTLASITNKRADEASTYLQYMLNDFWTSEVVSQNQPVHRRISAIRCCTWICRALEARVYPLLPQFTDKYIACFADKDLSWDAAVGIGQFSSSEKILSKRNHAVIRVLHSQRFFNTVLDRLVAGAKDAENPDTQPPHLVTLTCLLRSVPKATYMDRLSMLLPLLLRGLLLSDSDVKANVIDTLLIVAEEDSIRQSPIAEHVSTLINAMLQNVAGAQSTARVKVSALKYLSILPDLVRYDLLHPHKAKIIKSLATALDDPNKRVRREAVDAR
ncbi:Dos2-interacting transcription regulator of RNA-Pol-II-domain-containing protein [Pterulicium gracile]|uniref:MMS19 nucleotide excision repair protein n=1 Tax=Pterulicium gracile TaxID=1884261 RepID=A0A5C3QIN7_9AGAR|nr:Dos2-interacting transcription regulator of RNA-Pol-II-domain-containing protein [Pterula gracilis]